ncbi:hypothetical protein CARUB_v10021781mg [Capsella rubella]|uniref:Uncharacterized protein n=1 Tax=Capsella rubella TaxID=81985 RepID=R0GEM9_9BRAS|nr:hypothetical protein CARUB_v10021781mg [Capsella rubella]
MAGGEKSKSSRSRRSANNQVLIDAITKQITSQMDRLMNEKLTKKIEERLKTIEAQIKGKEKVSAKQVIISEGDKNQKQQNSQSSRKEPVDKIFPSSHSSHRSSQRPRRAREEIQPLIAVQNQQLSSNKEEQSDTNITENLASPRAKFLNRRNRVALFPFQRFMKKNR